jgi:hypothetical protein
MKIGFPPDVERAVRTLHRFTAGDPTVLGEALVLARRQSRVRGSKLLVAELLIHSLIDIELRQPSGSQGTHLVAIGAD